MLEACSGWIRAPPPATPSPALFSRPKLAGNVSRRMQKCIHVHMYTCIHIHIHTHSYVLDIYRSFSVCKVETGGKREPTPIPEAKREARAAKKAVTPFDQVSQTHHSVD